MIRPVYFISLLILIFFSCEEGFVTDCRECTEAGIGDVELELIFGGSPVYEPLYKTVTIYEGAIEDSLILNRFTTELAYMTIDAMLYKNYTVTLNFKIGGKDYIAVDAVCPKVRYDESSCDQPCYYIYDNVADLRLRYEK
jgi:hypothetical protein